MKTLPLEEGVEIPVLGLGTWQLKGETAQSAVEKALEVGYRLIDTADAYGNHKEVALAIKNSGIKRVDLFLTTKIWQSDLNRENVISAGNRFLNELEVDYIDLLLIHWPNKEINLEETLEAMNELKRKGIIRSIGVSNFTINHLKDSLNAKVRITNNQVEIHPTLSQIDLRNFCKENNIIVTAYSPIAQGQDLHLPLIQNLAAKYNKPPSHVILNWIIQSGMVAIPRSSNIEHIVDNFRTLDWELEKQDVDEIDNLNSNNRLINPSFSEFDH